MKGFVSYLYLASISLFFGAHATEAVLGPAKYLNKTTGDVTVMGPLTGQNLKAGSVTVYGPLTLSENSIVESADVYGPLTANNCLFKKNVKVYGPLLANNASFNGTTVVYGPVDAKNSAFTDTLTVYSDVASVKLADTKAKNIVITTTAASVIEWLWGMFTIQTKNVSKVTLTGTTIVSGSITFEGGTGVVEVSGSAQVKGKVINGELKKVT